MDLNGIFSNVQALDFLQHLPTLSWEPIFTRTQFSNKGRSHSTAVISDRVFIGEGTEIGAYVVIEDDVLIGKNCVIRPGSYIRSSTVIEDNCVIGHAAELKHAYICAGAKIQGRVFVGDSIVGSGARLGTGVVIGNRRFDQREVAWQTESGAIPSGSDKLGALIGDYVRLGANVTTNPGTIIGAHTWVSGGRSVGGFIPPKKFVKPNGEVTENRFEGELRMHDKEGNL